MNDLTTKKKTLVVMENFSEHTDINLCVCTRNEISEIILVVIIVPYLMKDGKKYREKCSL